MSYMTILRNVPEALSQPAGIAALASLGIHGAIAFLLPLMPVDSSKSTKQASINKPLDVTELTPSEQSRIPSEPNRTPQVTALQTGVPNTVLPFPTQGQIPGQQSTLPGVPNTVGSNNINGINSNLTSGSGVPIISTTPPLPPFQTNSLPNQGKISSSSFNPGSFGRTISSSDFNGRFKLPVTPRGKVRPNNQIPPVDFINPPTPTSDVTANNNGKNQPSGEDDNTPVNVKNPFENINAGKPTDGAVAYNPDGTQKIATPIPIQDSGETTPNTSTTNNSSLSGGYASNIKTGDGVINQIVKFREQYKDLVTAAPIAVISDSDKITGIVDGGMVIKNKAGEVDSIELLDGSKPPKEVRDAVLSYLQKNKIEAIKGRPTYVSFRISPKSGGTTAETPVKQETNQVQQPVVIPGSTIPGNTNPVKVEAVQPNNSTTTPVKPTDKLRQILNKPTEVQSSSNQVVIQDNNKPTVEKKTTSTEVKPLLSKLRQFRDQRNNSNQ